MNKLINQSGQKAYQRGSDNEDRALGYRKWLRTVNCGGFMDIDLIKFKDGMPVAITELTRCDSEDVPSEEYFNAITNRWYIRDGQASLVEEVSKRLGVPAYLIVFNKDLLWFAVWDFQIWKWSKAMNKEEYINWLTNL